MLTLPHEPESQTLAIGAIDLGVALAHAVQIAGPRILRRGLELRVVPPGCRLLVTGDASRTPRWLARVADALAERLPPGGRVTLTASREGDAGVLRLRATSPQPFGCDPVAWLDEGAAADEPRLDVVARGRGEVCFAARLPLREPSRPVLAATGS